VNTTGADTTALPASLRAWVEGSSGSRLLARALEVAAQAERDGHACARLEADPQSLAELRRHPWISDGSTPGAAVIDETGRIFFWRNWVHEQRIAEAIRARVASAEIAVDAHTEGAIEALFSGVPADLRPRAQRQINAVRGSLGKRFFVLSGGPGTGKTTTVLRMLLIRQRMAMRAGGVPLAMALAAPTGKAAQRLSQAVRDGAARLRDALGERAADWQAAFEHLPEAACTLHRLLGSNPREDRHAHDAERPLEHDLVVVDEASMVDLGLMRALLDALRPDAALILVGDPDQLVSVGEGSVLADIVAVAEAGGFTGHHLRLTENWRTSELGGVYEAVRLGDAAALRAAVDAAPRSVLLKEVRDQRALAELLECWVARPEWAALDAAIDGDPDQVERAFAALRTLQLLTALRSGPYGSESLNPWIDQRRRRRYGDRLWYPGRPVLVRGNDYTRRLFNGDVGIALPEGARMAVCFEYTDESGVARHRFLSTQELPDHDLGYALTVHKSQGSEYRHVALLLPPQTEHRILSRQLLYTGVSRAKAGLEIWSDPQSLAKALARVTERAGGLRERLGYRPA